MIDEKIILIKGDKTKWYDQAIFIVNDNAPISKIPVNLVMEAENIISNYFNGGIYDSYKKNMANELDPNIMKNLENNSKFIDPNSVTTKKKSKKTRQFDFMLNLILLIICTALFIIVGSRIFGY